MRVINAGLGSDVGKPIALRAFSACEFVIGRCICYIHGKQFTSGWLLHHLPQVTRPKNFKRVCFVFT